ncbi:hypothetical protein [Butyrivibrio hungatei]|nr:hypothetical protein [Butyrivibrio hungatei]
MFNLNQTRPAIKLERLQKIQTEGDKMFRFGDVVLIKTHIFSRKLTPFDTLTGKEIQKIALYEENVGKFILVDVKSFRHVGIFKPEFTCWYTGEEAA